MRSRGPSAVGQVRREHIHGGLALEERERRGSQGSSAAPPDPSSCLFYRFERGRRGGHERLPTRCRAGARPHRGRGAPRAPQLQQRQAPPPPSPRRPHRIVKGASGTRRSTLQKHYQPVVLSIIQHKAGQGCRGRRRRGRQGGQKGHCWAVLGQGRRCRLLPGGHCQDRGGGLRRRQVARGVAAQVQPFAGRQDRFPQPVRLQEEHEGAPRALLQQQRGPGGRDCSKRGSRATRRRRDCRGTFLVPRPAFHCLVPPPRACSLCLGSSQFRLQHARPTSTFRLPLFTLTLTLTPPPVPRPLSHGRRPTRSAWTH